MTDFSAEVEAAERRQLIADLHAARDEMVARGRCRGVQLAHDDRVCALGAIGLATGEHFLSASSEPFAYTQRQMRVRRILEDLLPAHVQWTDGNGSPVLYLYNDFPDTTDQDMLNLFDKALAELGGLS